MKLTCYSNNSLTVIDVSRDSQMSLTWLCHGELDSGCGQLMVGAGASGVVIPCVVFVNWSMGGDRWMLLDGEAGVWWQKGENGDAIPNMPFPHSVQ